MFKKWWWNGGDVEKLLKNHKREPFFPELARGFLAMQGKNFLEIKRSYVNRAPNAEANASGWRKPWQTTADTDSFRTSRAKLAVRSREPRHRSSAISTESCHSVPEPTSCLAVRTGGSLAATCSPPTRTKDATGSPASCGRWYDQRTDRVAVP